MLLRVPVRSIEPMRVNIVIFRYNWLPMPRSPGRHSACGLLRVDLLFPFLFERDLLFKGADRRSRDVQVYRCEGARVYVAHRFELAFAGVGVFSDGGAGRAGV